VEVEVEVVVVVEVEAEAEVREVVTRRRRVSRESLRTREPSRLPSKRRRRADEEEVEGEVGVGESRGKRRNRKCHTPPGG
jgi:hypothetical protein